MVKAPSRPHRRRRPSRDPDALRANRDDREDRGDRDDREDRIDRPDPPNRGFRSASKFLGTESFADPNAISATPVTGQQVLEFARKLDGQEYVLGARAPLANPNYSGPWDCAEFCSWCVYQQSNILFGVEPRHDPILADAYTGFWATQSVEANCRIPVADAISTSGALLLRAPATDRGGHIAFSDGAGGTMEAKGRATGVGAFKATGRRWDYGVLVPGIRYFRSDTATTIASPPHVLRVTNPLMRGKDVEAVQTALKKRSFAIGAVDAVYGPQTEAAVVAFQESEGLTPDGEVGKETRMALFK